MKPRPTELPSKTYRVLTGYGNLYVTITEDEGKPFEVFCSIGKSGQGLMAKAEVTGRLVSLCLRNGVSPEEIFDQLIGIAGDHPQASGSEVILSIPDAVGKILKRVYGGEK